MARIRRRSPAGLTLAIVAGVPCPGKGEIRMDAAFLGVAGLAVLSLTGILACSHVIGLPFTKRMIWSLALACGVLTPALLPATLL